MSSSCETAIMNITGFDYFEDMFRVKNVECALADEIVELRKKYKRLSEDYSRVFDSFKENDKLGNDVVLISKSLTDISISLMKLQEEEKEKKLQYEKISKYLAERTEVYSNFLFGKNPAFQCKVPTPDELFPFKKIEKSGTKPSLSSKASAKPSKVQKRYVSLGKMPPIIVSSGPTIGLEEMIAKNQVIVEKKVEEVQEVEDMEEVEEVVVNFSLVKKQPSLSSYTRLGLERDASCLEIKKAHKKFVTRFHPYKNLERTRKSYEKLLEWKNYR